jgi:hypothetical protein
MTASQWAGSSLRRRLAPETEGSDSSVCVRAGPIDGTSGLHGPPANRPPRPARSTKAWARRGGEGRVPTSPQIASSVPAYSVADAHLDTHVFEVPITNAMVASGTPLRRSTPTWLRSSTLSAFARSVASSCRLRVWKACARSRLSSIGRARCRASRVLLFISKPPSDGIPSDALSEGVQKGAGQRPDPRHLQTVC